MYSNKPVTYPKGHKLLQTDLFEEAKEIMSGNATGEASKAAQALKKVFGLPLPTTAKKKRAAK